MKLSNKKTVLVSALLLELSVSAHAATITVDGSTCDLANAIIAANSDSAVGGCVTGSGDDELLLPLDSTITLTTALPAITSTVTIEGNNATIQRDLSSPTFRVLTVTGGSLTLRDTTISQGDVSYTLSGTGPFSIGGGIQVSSGVLNIERSTISSNQGGGVLFTNSNGSIVDSVISDNYGFNESDYFYGAGVTVNCSDVTIDRSTIESNTSFAFPGGAGIIQFGTCATTLDITNSTISNNISNNWGGGILTDATGATLNLSQVTVTKNVCNVSGSGLGCAMNSFNTSTYVSQSLFSGNMDYAGTGTGATNEINTTYIVEVDNYSIIGLNGSSGSTGLSGGPYIIPNETTLADIIDLNLTDNGGLTPTHALNLNGPAVDVIPLASCDSAIDQTNKARPINVFSSPTANCDIGAFESPTDIIFKDGFEMIID